MRKNVRVFYLILLSLLLLGTIDNLFHELRPAFAGSPQIITAPASTNEVVMTHSLDSANGLFSPSTSSPGPLTSPALLANSHTLKRLFVTLRVVGVGCPTLAVVSFRDETSGTDLTTLSISNGSSTVDSGALSIAMTAGDRFALHLVTLSAGCTTVPSAWVAATYQ